MVLLQACYKPCSALEYEQQQQNVKFMYECLGHIQHIAKIRMDCKLAANICSRYSHAPCDIAMKNVKQCAHYLIGTPDIGWECGHPGATLKDLIWHEKLPDDYVYDPSHKILAYHGIVDGALSPNDRSITGTIHMFGGAAIDANSSRQHSIAEHAYVSEAYSGSIICAGSIVFRGMCIERGIDQTIPTPIFSDSRSTLLAVRSMSSLKKSLYILRRTLFMIEGHDEGLWDFYTCKGPDNPADVFTKPVGVQPFTLARAIYLGHHPGPLLAT